MGSATLIGYQIAVTAKSAQAAIQYALLVSSPGHNDFLNYDITVTNAISFRPIIPQPSLYLNPAIWSPVRVYGAQILLDQGTGTLTPLSPKLWQQVTINGSIENFGVREATVRIFGDFSPFKSSLFRASRAIKIYGYGGVPGSVESRLVFNGFVRDVNFDGYPQSVTITAQDSSLPFSVKQLFYNLDPGSRKTRHQVWLDICAANGITAGKWDVLNDGGSVQKPITEGGSRSILQFFMDFFAPIGVRAHWLPDGTMNVARFRSNTRLDTAGSNVWPARVLYPNDIRSLQVTIPAANAANSVQVTSNALTVTTPSGTQSTFVSQPTVGTYTPRVGVNKQSYIDGSVSAVSIGSSAFTGELARVDTISIFSGDTLVSQTVTEYGFYARLACRRYQSTGGAITWNPSYDVYQFPDGTWRYDEIERYQKIRETVTTWFYPAIPGPLGQQTMVVYGFTGWVIPSGVLDGSLNESRLLAYIAENGEAWITGAIPGGVEQWMMTSKTVTSYSSLFGGITQIQQVGVPVLPIDTSYRLGNKITSALVMGPTTARWYASTDNNTTSLFIDTARSTRINETSYSQSHVRTEPPNHYNNFASVLSASQPTINQGGLPSVPLSTSTQQSSQQVTATVTDKVRVDLIGTTITDYQTNDFAETLGECHTAAVERLRDLCSPRVSVQMDLDWTIDEGSVVRVVHSDLALYDGVHNPGISGVNLLVLSVSRTLDGSMAKQSQTLTCRWDPPELFAM